MAGYGYDWHQTTVGRAETATRPLRLNEAVALAALFDVPVTQMVAPMALKAPDIDAEIEAELKHWEEVRAAVDADKRNYDWTREEAAAAQEKFRASLAEAERVQARLNYLHGVRAITQGKPADPALGILVNLAAQAAQEQEGRR